MKEASCILLSQRRGLTLSLNLPVEVLRTICIQISRRSSSTRLIPFSRDLLPVCVGPGVIIDADILFIRRHGVSSVARAASDCCLAVEAAVLAAAVACGRGLDRCLGT